MHTSQIDNAVDNRISDMTAVSSDEFYDGLLKTALSSEFENNPDGRLALFKKTFNATTAAQVASVLFCSSAEKTSAAASSSSLLVLLHKSDDISSTIAASPPPRVTALRRLLLCGMCDAWSYIRKYCVEWLVSLIRQTCGEYHHEEPVLFREILQDYLTMSVTVNKHDEEGKSKTVHGAHDNRAEAITDSDSEARAKEIVFPHVWFVYDGILMYISSYLSQVPPPCSPASRASAQYYIRQLAHHLQPFLGHPQLPIRTTAAKVIAYIAAGPDGTGAGSSSLRLATLDNGQSYLQSVVAKCLYSGIGGDSRDSSKNTRSRRLSMNLDNGGSDRLQGGLQLCLQSAALSSFVVGLDRCIHTTQLPVGVFDSICNHPDASVRQLCADVLCRVRQSSRWEKTSEKCISLILSDMPKIDAQNDTSDDDEEEHGRNADRNEAIGAMKNKNAREDSDNGTLEVGLMALHTMVTFILKEQKSSAIKVVPSIVTIHHTHDGETVVPPLSTLAQLVRAVIRLTKHSLFGVRRMAQQVVTPLAQLTARTLSSVDALNEILTVAVGGSVEVCPGDETDETHTSPDGMMGFYDDFFWFLTVRARLAVAETHDTNDSNGRHSVLASRQQTSPHRDTWLVEYFLNERQMRGALLRPRTDFTRIVFYVYIMNFASRQSFLSTEEDGEKSTGGRSRLHAEVAWTSQLASRCSPFLLDWAASAPASFVTFGLNISLSIFPLAISNAALPFAQHCAIESVRYLIRNFPKANTHSNSSNHHSGPFRFISSSSGVFLPPSIVDGGDDVSYAVGWINLFQREQEREKKSPGLVLGINRQLATQAEQDEA